MPDNPNEAFRFGSAGWSDEAELEAAGLLDGRGPQIGFSGDRPLSLDGDAPMITIGGAGSGKTRDLLGYVVCNSPGQRMVGLDPRGELCAISQHVHAAFDEHCYSWNPVRIAGVPHHRCDPLDILDPNSRNFHSDCKFLSEGFIALSGGGNSKYFEMRAREWLENLMKSRAEMNGRTSLPDLYRVINSIEADRNAWADQLEGMMKSEHASVRRVAAEMLTKQQDTPKEFGAVMGEIYAHMNFLDDPNLLASLEHAEFSMEEVINPSRVSKIFLIIPAEYLSIWSPLVRLFFTVAMLYKSRSPQSERVLLLVDEAGQLGQFETLLRAFTFGRGAGIRAWAIFQDAGQIVRNFGHSALQGFLGSAQMRQFFGVRDYETARLVSSMLGTETLEFDDTLRQDEARERKRDALRNVLRGGDPFEEGRKFAHFARASTHRTQQARALMTPEEVLAMPEDRQILFISGKNLKPIYAAKYPYYSRPEMAGHYLPNPYHPPADQVPIRERGRDRWRRVITEPVRARYASFPQYPDGIWSYVEGFKP